MLAKAYSVTTLAAMTAFMIGLTFGKDLSPSQKQVLENTIQRAMSCSDKIAAGSVSLLSLEHGIRFTRGFKNQKYDYRGRIDYNSAFCIGGATQAFTAVLLAMLMENHTNVTWDTPVQDIIGHRLAMPNYHLSDSLTLKDILTMRSGLSGMEIVPLVKPYSQETLINNLRYAPTIGGFREKFVYSEIPFALIEKVVQVLGGSTWQHLMQEKILKPLDMTATLFAGTSEANRSPSLVGGTSTISNTFYSIPNEAYSGLSLVAPAAGLCTTGGDILKWMQFLLNGGHDSTNKRLITKDALETTFTSIQSRGHDDDPVIQGYKQPTIQTSYTRDQNALGWISGYYRGHQFVSQDGSLPGYQTLITVVPSNKAAVFVTLSGDPSAEHFATKVLLNILGIDILTQGSHWISDANVCGLIKNIAESTRSKNVDPLRHITASSTPAPRPLEDYTGTFRHYAFGDVHVKFNSSGQNSLTLEYGIATYTLGHTNRNDTFQLIANDRNMWYSTNGDWYRENQRILAVFSVDSRDPEMRITSVTIEGFDKHYSPEFSLNARPPPYGESREDCRCSAANLGVWQYSILLIALLSYLR